MIAFYLPGGIAIYTFSLLLGIGTAAGLAWAAWMGRAIPPAEKSEAGLSGMECSADRFLPLPCLEAGLWSCLGALVGGRLTFAAANWTYFQSSPLEILQVSQGGLSWVGALAGALAALVLYAALLRQPLAHLADALVPLLAALVISAWLACWIDGFAYGPEVSGWWGLPARDEWGNLAQRLPTQLLGALLALLLFWFLETRRSPVPGRRALLAVLGLAIQLWLLSFLRADPGLTWRGQRLDTWAALGFMAVSGVPLLLHYWRRNKR